MCKKCRASDLEVRGACSNHCSSSIQTRSMQLRETKRRNQSYRSVQCDERTELLCQTARILTQIPHVGYVRRHSATWIPSLMCLTKILALYKNLLINLNCPLLLTWRSRFTFLTAKQQEAGNYEHSKYHRKSSNAGPVHTWWQLQKVM
jgi:hypothetical protein